MRCVQLILPCKPFLEIDSVSKAFPDRFAGSQCGLAPISLRPTEPVLHVYNWSDYIADGVLGSSSRRPASRCLRRLRFQRSPGGPKLLAGHSEIYDLVFPTARPFAQRHIKAGIYRKVDKTGRLPNCRIDP